MSESNSTIGDEVLDEARATIEGWAVDIDDSGPEFQTLHMFASYLLAIADRALPKIDADERAKILRAARMTIDIEPIDSDWSEFNGEPQR